MGPGFWRTYDRALGDGAAALRASVPASRVAATVAEVHAALAGTARLAVTACAPAGVVRVAVGEAGPARLGPAVERLRAFVAADDGSLVIERGPAALRAAVDPWGPVPGPALELMRALKQEFDPRGTLNPGRFVGGI
jgi:glycolate oxidase FAD binding subunit